MAEQHQTFENPRASEKYSLVVYGSERVGLRPTFTKLESSRYIVSFENFATKSRLSDFDGAIVFQGIFENFEPLRHLYTYEGPKFKASCARDELDKRDKEMQALLKKGGFVCFVVWQSTVESDDIYRYEKTDLMKRWSNWSGVYRKNFGERSPIIRCIADEFRKFLEFYGAASVYFEIIGSDIDVRRIAVTGRETVGMVLGDALFFVPSLLPEEARMREYFEVLAESVVSLRTKIIRELPAWADEFRFDEEHEVREERENIRTRIREIDDQVASFRLFKRLLVGTGEDLVRAVANSFEQGFGFKVDQNDEYREDLKLVNATGDPLMFCEVKGINSNVKREHVNQADNHRERAGFSADAPAVLVANTFVKNSKSIEDKDQPVPSDQVQHARRNNVLILRTLDLLRLLRIHMRGDVSAEDVLQLLCQNSGWLEVTDASHRIHPS